MTRKMRSVSFVVVLVIMLMAVVSPLQAASFVQPIKRVEQFCGSSRCVSLSGKVNLATGESVSEVRIFVQGANGVPLSDARGTYNSATTAWSADIGDFQLVSYYVAITIKQNGRVIGALRTPTYYWGVP